MEILTAMNDKHFLHFIKSLRENEEVILHRNVWAIDEDEAYQVMKYLKVAYQKETLAYPFTAPIFYGEAALWAAKTAYVAAQLILYRENKAADLRILLPNFEGDTTPSSILSVDLCLRFLPNMITQLKLIDTEDELVLVLEEKMTIWHYSAINYFTKVADSAIESILKNDCLRQLYLDRIIENKNLKLAKHPLLADLILANLGMFTADFWPALK